MTAHLNHPLPQISTTSFATLSYLIDISYLVTHQVIDISYLVSHQEMNHQGGMLVGLKDDRTPLSLHRSPIMSSKYQFCHVVLQHNPEN